MTYRIDTVSLIISGYLKYVSILIIFLEVTVFGRKTKIAFYSLLLILGFGAFNSANAIVPFPFLPFLDNNEKQSRNLVFILDVKQQESYLGACGYVMATALQDQVAPIIASAHALSFVSEYFTPKEWHIYQKNNLVLFIPKKYMKSHDFNDPQDAGFVLDGWQVTDGAHEYMRVSDFYKTIQHESIATLTFSDLSKQSVDIITQTFETTKKYSWKIYAVGHGAPDAHQVCGLNLQDFKELLNTLETNISTNFFIYQTCFGGGLDQLKNVYTDSQGIFRKFSFPIISGALTNSVSFGFQPESGTSFKKLFSKVNNTMIAQRKMRLLLKAVNDLNKCLEMASDYHMTNNLLLIRLPQSESFEPVADNKSVFKMTELQALNDEEVRRNCADKEKFKCLLVNHPIINETIDVSQFKNFIIASGLSRSKHYIKEIKFAAYHADNNHENNHEERLANTIQFFSSLGFPEVTKEFYIDSLIVGDKTYKNVSIFQNECGYYSSEQHLIIKAMAGTTLYSGEVIVATNHGSTEIYNDRIEAFTSEEIVADYVDGYEFTVNKHLKKKHANPLGHFLGTLLG